MTVELLQIEPTTRCNFTCGFCCGRALPQSNLSPALLERALDEYPTVRHLELQGEGEPLMHPGFFDMVAQARHRGIPVSLVTNGSHFTPHNIALILEGGIEKVSISLESADPQTFRAIRGGKLEKVVGGIEALVAARNARGLTRPVVGFSITMMRRTSGHLAGIVELYRRLQLDGGVTTQVLQQMPAYTAVYDLDMAAERVADVDYRLLDFHRRTRRLQSERRSTDSFYDHLLRGWRPTTRSCPWLERGLYIDRDGMISACCSIKDPRHALGQLGQDGPAGVLARRTAMRDELGQGRIPAACTGCEVARYATMSPGRLARGVLRGGLRVLSDLVERP
jgi:MoaA/NifB/PqqE/SkfB family radical SAM enzyme